MGTACGLGVEGSGWVVAPELVVTNAHVVAGEAEPLSVQPGGHSPGLTARAVVFDPHDDIALLDVPGLSLPALAHRCTPAGRHGGRHPGLSTRRPIRRPAGRIGQTETVNTQDAYGNGPIQRSITTLRGYVRPGNSGGPLVDAAGKVVGTVFAAIVGSPGQRGGFAVPNALVATASSPIVIPARCPPASARADRRFVGLASDGLSVRPRFPRARERPWAGGGLHTARP